MLPTFEKSRGSRTTSRETGKSSSKSKKFDLTKWFKQSTSCGVSSKQHSSMFSDSDDSTTPFVSMTHSSSSSSASTPEMGVEMLDNGDPFSRYNIRSPFSSNKPISNPMFEQESTNRTTTLPSYIKTKMTGHTNIRNNNELVKMSDKTRVINPICSSYKTPPSSSEPLNDQPYPLHSTQRGRNINNAVTRHAEDSTKMRDGFFPNTSSSSSTSSSLSSSTSTNTSTRPFLKPRKKERVWRSAKDAKSGKTYYYEIHTRETQWHKPLELASDSERLVIQEKERIQKEFFSSMEANIIKCMQKGVIPGSPKGGGQEDKIHPLKARVSLVKKDLAKPLLIKTISSMDAELLAELTRGKSEDDQDKKTRTSALSPDSVLIPNNGNFVRAVSNGGQQRRHSQRHDDEIQEVVTSICRGPEAIFKNSTTLSPKENLIGLTNGGVQGLKKPSFDRRNTCGTLYVKSTMAAPDKDATIKCVCGVFRAHLLQAATESYDDTSQKIKFSEYEVFNDSPSERGNNSTSSTSIRTSRINNNIRGRATVIEESNSEIEMSTEADKQTIPSLEEITDFYRFVFNKAQMESDCIIVSLIYVERLLRDTNGGVSPNSKNWRSVLFSCMVMASKVWDDLSMWNKDFSHVCPSGLKFPLKRINELELALLNCLKFNVKVLASEYAKYYFLMRSMLIRSGLVGEELMTMKPLDNEGAKRLEFITTNYKPLPKPEKASQRSKSVGEVTGVANPGIQKEGDTNQLPWRPISKQVNLEQVVNM
eukprot:CAMPEP_0198258432 /NCGR_PEP_ID=MMETSP1447-20131203/7862_1 /TAXON_ID=420782 /ORGANISM="Chaetoceros dichaeta, Strain CCMP1751" /LENGTH=760 /DNA_ID=CAMNT_0043945551 /DNA_START=94 /DNA_END=2376 /DNA_ORIENTATION=-